MAKRRLKKSVKKLLTRIIFTILITTSCSIVNVKAKKCLDESIIVIDPGHGGLDVK